MEHRSCFVGARPNFGAVATMFPSIPRRYLDDILHSRLNVNFSSMAASPRPRHPPGPGQPYVLDFAFSENRMEAGRCD